MKNFKPEFILPVRHTHGETIQPKITQTKTIALKLRIGIYKEGNLIKKNFLFLEFSVFLCF